MTQVYLKYNPYRLETEIKVNGDIISKDSILKKIKGKRLQEWIGELPQLLKDEYNSVDFEIEFYGMPLDKDDVEESFNNALQTKSIKNLRFSFIEGKSDENINEKVVEIFTDLQNGPIDDFRSPKLIQAFNNINNTIFSINVIATMSSGKSTLINALLAKRLMPSKNEACTATITEILDNDKEKFVAVAYDKDDVVLANIAELTYENMSELNDNKDVHRIAVEGNIPFLDAKDTTLKLIDTPGPNNSQDQEHKNTTYRAINNDSNSLILYVLNGTQLSTNDDSSLLEYVAEQMKKGGKQVRDRFLFVLNKMDGFNPEEENIEEMINSAKNYLASKGIEDPQIFPCSAFTALNIRTYLAGIDVNNLTRQEERQLPIAARDTLPMIDKFVEVEAMHLEQYSTLAPSAQQELNYRLIQAEKNEDITEQALIHCGIYSIEAAIKAYVKKYAKTKKVKDLVETFEEVLESSKVLANAKQQVVTDEAAAKACAERAKVVKEKIDNGKEATSFKKRVDALNPMETIKVKTKKLQDNAMLKAKGVFGRYTNQTITNRDEAKRLIQSFGDRSSDITAEFTAEVESIINKEIVEAGKTILAEYQEKLTKIDEEVNNTQLDFETVDLIKGTLSSLREGATVYSSDNFVTDTIDGIGEVTYEDKVYYEKVGQEEEEVADGTEEVKIGTERVKTGTKQEWVGTRSKKNPKKKGLFGWIKFWEDDYIEEDVYENVDVYEDRDVFKTVIKYKTVLRDVFEERVEKIEHFSVEVPHIQSALIAMFADSLDNGIDEIQEWAEVEVANMIQQFKQMFNELDNIIKQKYTELEECIVNQKTKEEELIKNKKILEWIEVNMSEIEELINI